MIAHARRRYDEEGVDVGINDLLDGDYTGYFDVSAHRGRDYHKNCNMLFIRQQPLSCRVFIYCT